MMVGAGAGVNAASAAVAPVAAAGA
jgi:hypothetical protein